MTIEKKAEFRLLRTPRPPKLEKIDLKKLNDSFDDIDSDTPTFTLKNNEDLSSLSTIRDYFSSSSSYLNRVTHQEHRIVLPSFADSQSNPTNVKSNSKSSSASSLPSQVDENNQLVDQNFYMKTFEKNVFKGRKLATIKSATYEPVENKSSSAVEQTVNKTLRKSLKSLGPDPLPRRPLKFHSDDIENKRTYYDSLTYQDDYCFYENAYNFDLNDFLLREARAHFCIPSNLNSAYISHKNYREICKMLADKIDEMRSIDSKQVGKINFFEYFSFKIFSYTI